jgi:hypothetical protein
VFLEVTELATLSLELIEPFLMSTEADLVMPPLTLVSVYCEGKFLLESFDLVLFKAAKFFINFYKHLLNTIFFHDFFL